MFGTDKKNSVWSPIISLIFFGSILLIFGLHTVHIYAQQPTSLYVAPTGSDSNNGSQQKPFKTIQKAANTVKPGTTVHVLPGTYPESVLLKTSGAATARITFVSDTTGGAKIAPNKTSGITNNASYIDIVGFDITAQNFGIDNFGSNVKVMNNTIHNIPAKNCALLNGGGGIVNELSKSHDTIINGNSIHDIGTGTCATVEAISQSSKGGSIWNNIVYKNAGYGIFLGQAPNDVTVANNLVFNNKFSGITLSSSIATATGGAMVNNIIVANNISMDNVAYGISETGSIGMNNIIANNIVLNNKKSNFYLLNGNQDTGTIASDPQLVNYKVDGTGDYHLTSASPAVDNGVSTGAPTTDSEGNQRPQGNGFDIGPYELTTIGIGLPSGTITPNPTGSSGLSLSVFLHGIGLGGDNANILSKGNNTPVQLQRQVQVSFFDDTDQQVSTLQGTVNYVSSDGNYQGSVDLNSIPSGVYTVKVKTSGFLQDTIPGIQTVTAGQIQSVAPVRLVAGDINNDNELNTADYAMLVDCYGNKQNEVSCQSQASDLNDDGVVDGADYNLFLRELSVQKGN